MSHPGHGREHGQSLNALALAATLHCLSGCALGEVLGMVLGTALGWSNGATVAASILLAFALGYGLTSLPLVRSGLPLRTGRGPRIRLAIPSRSATMEAVDTLIVLAVPGALDAGLSDLLFWGSLAAALLVAGGAAYPVNRRLISRGKGHAVVHAHHH